MNNNTEGFGWNVHAYLNEYIRFGDTKAAVICGLSGSLVVWLAQTSEIDRVFDLSWIAMLGLIAIVCLGFSFCFGFIAIWPNLTTFNIRLRKRPSSLPSELSTQLEKGFIFWKSILVHANARSFSIELCKLSDEDLTKHVANHCFELANIADKKYQKITVASSFFAIGLCFLAAYFFVCKHQSAKSDDVNKPNGVQVLHHFPSPSNTTLSNQKPNSI